MKKITGRIVFAVLFAFLFVMTGRAQTEPEAVAVLINPEGEPAGTVMFSRSNQGVKIDLDITNLPPGRHAFHIHENGICEPPDFTSAGGHFNPGGTRHGFLNPAGPHAGDLPNIEVPGWTFQTTMVTGRLSLDKDAGNSVFKEGGTAVVIHEKPDDYITDPAGKGGPRIACGVIKPVE